MKYSDETIEAVRNDTARGRFVKTRSTIERFFEKVDKTDSCWVWTGTKNPQGYGQFQTHTTVRAHRYIYETIRGPIPDGLVLDHLCHNKSCVNPDHLEAVTRRENNERAATWAGNKTHCVNGHPRTPENLMDVAAGRGRGCKVCHRAIYHRDKHKTKRVWTKKAREA